MSAARGGLAAVPPEPAGALRAAHDVVPCLRYLDQAGSRLHPDLFKNWDLAAFQHWIARHVRPGEPVLDVGCASNPLLWNLAQQGYTGLHGIDFDVSPAMVHPHPAITYRQGDLLRCPYPDGSFACITSLSVMEHVGGPDAYFAEMARLLRPGGVLLTSTDYWPRKLRAKSLLPWRRRKLSWPWTIFSRSEVEAMLAGARRHGLEPAHPIDHAVGEPVIRWMGRSYTFLAFALRKGPAA